MVCQGTWGSRGIDAKAITGAETAIGAGARFAVFDAAFDVDAAMAAGRIGLLKPPLGPELPPRG